MRDYDFDRKVFDNHWAFPFTVLQYIFLIGFVLMCIAVALGAMTDLHITVPTFVVWLLCISFVGFPIVTIVKVGYSRLLRWSELKERDGRICFDRVVQAEYTAAGRSEEYNIYEVRKLTRTRMTRRYLIIEGDIRRWSSVKSSAPSKSREPMRIWSGSQKSISKNSASPILNNFNRRIPL